ncbi:hypothetical protein KKA50_01255 [Patescibacteria group bacterium]|nr:hypothetical protein [Patescibacteria group bacterium]
MDNLSSFATSYAFLFQSPFIDTEVNEWYEKVFNKVKDGTNFQELEDMLNRLPVDTRLYRLVRKELIGKARSPIELVSVVILTSRNSKEEEALVKQITELEKEGDEADQEEIKEMVRKRISSLNGDLKARMRRLFRELLEKEVSK